jgi:hypothetical protein
MQDDTYSLFDISYYNLNKTIKTEYQTEYLYIL